MNRKRLGSAILTSLVMALVGAVGAAFPAPSSKVTIRIESLGVAFDLPRGFAVLQQDIHGGPATIISVGKEFRPGHLKYAPLELVFWPTGYDGTRTVPEYSPSQYVDAEFNRVKESVRQHRGGFESEPEYRRLFGNNAVRYTYEGLDSYTIIVGYLHAEQLPLSVRQVAEEYLARIAITREIPADEFDRAYKGLVDTVVNSLRISR